jgi:hypothetical protein
MRQREVQRRGEAKDETEHAPVAPAPAPAHEALLRLQRSAGNALSGA